VEKGKGGGLLVVVNWFIDLLNKRWRWKGRWFLSIGVRASAIARRIAKRTCDYLTLNHLPHCFFTYNYLFFLINP
jgi:hypothetical protein